MDSNKISALAKHGAVKPEHLTKMLNRTNGEIDHDTFSELDDKIGFDSDHLHQIIKNPDNSLAVIRSVVRHPNAASDTYEHALDHYDDSDILRGAVKNAYEQSTIEKAVHHPKWYVRQRVTLNDHVTKDHLKHLLKDPEQKVSDLARDALWYKENQ